MDRMFWGEGVPLLFLIRFILLSCLPFPSKPLSWPARSHRANWWGRLKGYLFPTHGVLNILRKNIPPKRTKGGGLVLGLNNKDYKRTIGERIP